jgi:Domain of unknown function (DUF4157)
VFDESGAEQGAAGSASDGSGRSWDESGSPWADDPSGRTASTPWGEGALAAIEAGPADLSGLRTHLGLDDDLAPPVPGAAGGDGAGECATVQRDGEPATAAPEPSPAGDGGEGGPGEAESGGGGFAVQRKQNAETQLDDREIAGTAADGVAAASAPLPHLDAIQAAFGHHDVGHVRAAVGGDAASSAGAIGAEAYATGDRVGFAASPDLHTAAHEAAHVVAQHAGIQPLGGVGSAGDRYERDADEAADAVAAGRSAEAILDRQVGAGSRSASATTAVQRKAGDVMVNAATYLYDNAADLSEALHRHLAGVEWIQPDPRMTWSNQAAFGADLVRLILSFLGRFNEPTNLRQLCHPANPLAVVDQLRPMFGQLKGTAATPSPDNPHVGGVVGPSTWHPSIGIAIGQELETSVVASLRRLGPRWVASADRGTSDEARLDDTRSFVTYESLVPSHPMDRLVGRAMTGAAVFELQSAPEHAGKQPPGEEAAPQGATLRPVNFEWQGAHDPKLWNWVKADPPDASPEEVASSLFVHWKGTYGEQTSFLAYLLTAAPPLFGVPPDWAIRFRDAKDHAPADHKDSGPEDRVMAVAGGGAITDEIALHQAHDEQLPPVHGADAKAGIADLAAGNLIQLRFLIETLTPWGASTPVWTAYGFLAGKQTTLLSSADADLAAWARVLAGQRDNLQRIGAGVHEVVDKAKELGITDPKTPQAGTLAEILSAYARAAGASHLIDTCHGLIDQAAAKQGRLALEAVEGSAHGLSTALDGLRDQTSSDDHTRNSMIAGGNAIEDEAVALQSRLIAGGKVDAEELDRFAYKADRLALEARVHGAESQINVLKDAAHQAGDGFFASMSAAFSGEFSSLEDGCRWLQYRLAHVLELLDFDGQAIGAYGYRDPQHPENFDRMVHDAYRSGLHKAQAEFDDIAKNGALTTFLQHGANVVEWQAFRTACLKMIALLGVAVAAAATGGALAGGASELVTAAGGSEAVADLAAGATYLTTEASVNAVGQHEVMGTPLGDSFVENMIQSVGGMAILGSLEREASAVARVEEATNSIWKRMGKLGVVLRETATITGHTIMGAALGYVAHKMTTGQSQPPPATLREWLMQGAAIAIGRYVHGSVEGRMQAMERLARHEQFKAMGGEDLLTETKFLLRISKSVEKNPKAENALELLAKRRELLDDEQRFLYELSKDEEAMKAMGVTKQDVHQMIGDLHGQVRESHDQAFTEVTFTLSRLEELVPGAVWRGTPEQIKGALDEAGRQGAKVEQTREPNGTWKVSIDGREMELHERAEEGPAAAEGRKSKVVLAGDDEKLREAAEWLQPMDGTLDVVVHGTVDDLTVKIGGSEVHIDHRRLATYIRKAGGKYERIRLAACKSGMHPDGVAQHLANKLGIEVIAPTDVLWLREDGQAVIGPRETRDTGRWQTFEPKKAKFRWTKARESEQTADEGQARPANHEEDGHDGAVSVGSGDHDEGPATLDASMSLAKPAEQATAGRLATFPGFEGRTFHGVPPPDPGYDWVDDLGRTYDALGDGTKAKFFDVKDFMDSIDHHFRKMNDFTVIDMTGFSPEQIAKVRKHLETAKPIHGTVIRIGF